MPMYNLLEYSDNYSVTYESLWNYYRYEVDDAANENENNSANDFRINNDKAARSKSFEHKTN